MSPQQKVTIAEDPTLAKVAGLTTQLAKMRRGVTTKVSRPARDQQGKINEITTVESSAATLIGDAADLLNAYRPATDVHVVAAHLVLLDLAIVARRHDVASAQMEQKARRVLAKHGVKPGV